MPTEKNVTIYYEQIILRHGLVYITRVRTKFVFEHREEFFGFSRLNLAVERLQQPTTRNIRHVQSPDAYGAAYFFFGAVFVYSKLNTNSIHEV